MTAEQKGPEYPCGAKVVLFGCPLDSDERDESIREKHACMGCGREQEDPYPFILEFIRREVDDRLFEEMGSLDVPEWLRPVPPPSQKEFINVDNFVSFIDGDGCRTLAEMIAEHVIPEIFPGIPCMIGVDHALTGGVFKKLSELLSPEQVGLIVLDSHTDALPSSILSGAVQYDMESNPDSPHDPRDPFLQGRPDSYNASSFLHLMLEQGLLRPENLCILGISDYPPKRSFRVKDPRIKSYAGVYSGLKRRGVKLVTKKDLLTNRSKLKSVLRGMDTPYVYISVDMDVGARNAVEAVRFRNRQGLNERQIYGIVDELHHMLTRGIRLAGMDITEIDVRRAGAPVQGEKDRVFEIAANLIKKLCFDIP
jgi:arginase family enzyme